MFMSSLWDKAEKKVPVLRHMRLFTKVALIYIGSMTLIMLGLIGAGVITGAIPIASGLLMALVWPFTLATWFVIYPLDTLMFVGVVSAISILSSLWIEYVAKKVLDTKPEEAYDVNQPEPADVARGEGSYSIVS